MCIVTCANCDFGCFLILLMFVISTIMVIVYVKFYFFSLLHSLQFECLFFYHCYGSLFPIIYTQGKV